MELTEVIETLEQTIQLHLSLAHPQCQSNITRGRHLIFLIKAETSLKTEMTQSRCVYTTVITK
jgi:hypothetical protein